MNRQIVLDTETTGLEVAQGHRVIEIGCVELLNRRPTGNDFHRYVNPERAVDAQAVAVHGLSNDRLATEPVFSELAQVLWSYLEGAELIIHNAAFDIGFLDAEFARTGMARKLTEICTVTDTVLLARRLHPGQRASLDALCRRYQVDNSGRDLHGALLDARLLAEVYLAMTGGQTALVFDRSQAGAKSSSAGTVAAAVVEHSGAALRIVRATEQERATHRQRLAGIMKKSGRCLWDSDLTQ